MGSRAYLRPEQRRQQLLAAASRLFDVGGLTAISMAAVAREAGASRRLVYDHFEDLAALYEAFFGERVARYAAAIDRASAAGDGSANRSPVGAARALLAVPAEELRAIHLLIADPITPELAPAREALRVHLQARWLPAFGALGVDADTATALLWSLAASFVTIAELARRGEISSSAAEALVVAVAANVPSLVLLTSTPTSPEPTS